MTDTNATTPVNTIRFSWWCRQCGWWSEVDLCGYCSQCRHNLDRRQRSPSREELALLGECRRCRV
jgi:hypothetical protein